LLAITNAVYKNVLSGESMYSRLNWSYADVSPCDKARSVRSAIEVLLAFIIGTPLSELPQPACQKTIKEKTMYLMVSSFEFRFQVSGFGFRQFEF
jgi:hypothetical protein